MLVTVLLTAQAFLQHRPRKHDHLWRPIAAIVVTLLVSACAATPDTSPPLPNIDRSYSFAVENVDLFDGEKLVERTTVVVVNGKVSKIGENGPSGLTRIDGAGKFLIPGLIDSHVHVTNETELRDGLRFGVSVQLDMFTDPEFVSAEKNSRTKAGKSEKSDFYSAGWPITSERGMGTQYGLPFDTISGPEDAKSFVNARLTDGSDYIKILYEPSVEIFTTISQETLSAVITAAHDKNVLALVHTTSLEGARDAVAAGADGLVHVFGDVVIPLEFAKKIAAKDVFVISTLSGYATLDGEGLGPELATNPDLSPFISNQQKSALASAPAISAVDENSPYAQFLSRFDFETALTNIRRLHKAGVRIIAGSDAPNGGASHGVSLHGELELLVQAGLTPADALRAATSIPAAAFDLNHKGRIAPGLPADFLFLDENPLKDIRHSRSINRISKNGVWISRIIEKSNAQE